MKTALKILTIIILSLIFILVTLYISYLLITKDAVLDASKLTGAEQNVFIYDGNGNEITGASLNDQKKSVALEDLNRTTVNAFIASEDRTFYSHNGLNYKRMIKALFKNITSNSFKEGASTISQQLIKNTHLSHNKTIKRKLNEIRLTKQLEKKYSKDDILEMYLNTIYFGHNCYGLQSAAEFYFNKKADELNLNESASIVGLLISPNNYSPFKYPENCLKRRNTVLKSMLKCGYIDSETYNKTVNLPITPIRSEATNAYNSYIHAVFDEFEELNLNSYELTDNCQIMTYLDTDKQNLIEKAEYPCDNAVIISDNLSGGVLAYKSTINGARRQLGSAVKPIFVYAPSIEEKHISPFTKILDEKINYNGYSPENFDKKYHGYVTVADSIKYSYNIPSVKTLNSLTIKKCEKYLAAMDVELDDDEKNLSLALGGMKYGLSIKELADKYSIFPNGGNYRPSRFIKKIISKDGKIIYENDTVFNNVYSEGTCSLINEMLIETTKSGTAKKLKQFEFDIASKTGTCGNSDGNTDAYTISYTSENCIAVWLGDKDNKRSDITGGNDCCKIMKDVLTDIYKDHIPPRLETEKGTTTVNIDKEEYDNNSKIILADKICPQLNILSVKVLKNNVPKEISNRFSLPTIPTPAISVEDNTVKIQLNKTKFYHYIIMKNKSDVIYDGKWQEIICDNPDKGVYTYTVTPYFISDGKKYFGKEISLPSVNIAQTAKSPQIKIPEDWYNS